MSLSGHTFISRICSILIVCGIAAGVYGESPRADGVSTDRITLTGQVLASQGRGVAGSSVQAYAPSTVPSSNQVEYQSAGESTVGKDGRFAVSIPSGQKPVFLQVTGTDGQVGWKWIPAGETGDVTTVTLGKAGKLQGVVLDDTGEPLAGARVRVGPVFFGHSQNSFGIDEKFAPFETTTDSSGSFSFQAIPAEKEVELQIRAEGFGLVDTRFSRNEPIWPVEESLRFQLRRAARIEVRAISKADGTPVSDIVLEARNFRALPPQRGQCINAAEGRFLFNALPPGRYEIAPAMDGEKPVRWTGEEVDVELQAGQTRTVEYPVQPGRPVKLTLLDSETSKPIGMIRCGLWNSVKRQWVGGRSDSNGQVRLALGPGKWNLWADDDHGYIRGEEEPIEITEETLGDELIRRDFALKPLPALRGTCRTPDGVPVPNVRLSLLPSGRSARTDAHGEFVLRDRFHQWTHEQKRHVILLARDEANHRAAWMRVPEAAEDLDVVLEPGVTITTTAVDSQGQPIPNARASLIWGVDDASDIPNSTCLDKEGNGRITIPAIPLDMKGFLRITAKGHATTQVPLDTTGMQSPLENPTPIGSETRAIDLAPVRLPDREECPQGPEIEMIDVPEIHGGYAVWGATGRDHRGHIWVGVTADKVDLPSAHLFEYIPDTGEIIDRGSVVDELRKAGLAVEGTQQMKIHTKIYDAGDGYIYFASMDEKDESEADTPGWNCSPKPCEGRFAPSKRRCTVFDPDVARCCTAQ